MPSADWQKCNVENLLKKQEEYYTRLEKLEKRIQELVSQNNKSDIMSLIDVFAEDFKTDIAMRAAFESSCPKKWGVDLAIDAAIERDSQERKDKITNFHKAEGERQMLSRGMKIVKSLGLE